MNYLRPDIMDGLAERFVLGTMSKRARRRFDRLFDEHETVRRKVYALEAMMLPKIWSLPPVTPSELVWRRIARDIDRGRPAGVKRSRTGWPAAAVALGLAAIATSIGWWFERLQPPERIVETVALEPSVAIVDDGTGNALWTALVYPDLQRAEVQVSMAPAAQPTNDYQLWILRGDGVPVSLGLLPQTGQATIDLDADAVTALATGTTLAVSLEPQGGSPQPTPTGPVLYTATLFTR